MTDQHIAPDDYTWGMMPQAGQSPATPQPEPVDGFFSDADLRRWCVEQITKSRTCYDLAKEARALHDFMRGSIPLTR